MVGDGGVVLMCEETGFTLKAKPTKGSNGRYYFHIPKILTDMGMINPTTKYELLLIPIEENICIKKSHNPKTMTHVIIDLNNYVSSFKRLNFPRGYNIFKPLKTWYDQQIEDKTRIWIFYSKHLQNIVNKFPIPIDPKYLFCETKMKYDGKAADVDTNITGQMVRRIINSSNILRVYLFSGDKDLYPVVTACKKKNISFNVMVTHARFLSHDLKDVADEVIEMFPKAKLK